MTFTSVVGYHMQPLTCGVAKFNTLLAQRLGVPFVANTDTDHWGDFPLLSLKWAELDANHQTFTRSKCWPDVRQNSAEVMRTATAKRYGVFWHDAGDATITAHAEHVFYADPSLGSPGLWCPSLLTPSRPRTVRLFSFGMAHKLQTAHYAKVRQLLEAAGLDYRLRVSVGLHEGTDLADATQHFDALREILGADKVTILGILSDDAVAEELQHADYVLAFFEQGLRANNTTVHAAMDAGCQVVTNTDDDTPDVFRLAPLSNISAMGKWPRTRRSYNPHSWDNLIERMETLCEASASAPA
jgi:hypothetical protein